MNPLLINTFDNQGGAAIATYRIHRALRTIGVDSKLLVQVKKTDDLSVIGPTSRKQKLFAFVRPYLDQLLFAFYKDRKKVLFSSAWLPERFARNVDKINPDILHFFWVNGGMVKIESLKHINKPIIWTLHDMWPFTGGCHYDDECGKYRDSCGNCPVLRSKYPYDLSRFNINRKIKSWGDTSIVVVATSHWLANMARASALFKTQRIEVIPNAIDTNRYKPIDKTVARITYNLPLDKRLILFSAFNAASDKRKGNQFLVKALEVLHRQGWDSEVEFVVIGASRSDNLSDIGMKVHFMGQMYDEISQVLLYSAADVVVAPSMQENLSNTVMESLSCGTPVVAFEIGGMPDLIDHKKNGYLAVPFKHDDLANGITWILEDQQRWWKLSQHARKTVIERYSVEKVAQQYSSLYKSVLS